MNKKIKSKYQIFLSITFVLITLAIFVFAASYFRARPLITTPFTIQPITSYGVEVDNVGLFARYGTHRDPDRVYILGVFRGGNAFFGEEVTHKICVDELVALLAEINISRNQFRTQVRRNRECEISWSVYLHQNRDIHIMFNNNGGVVIVGREGRRYSLIGGSALAAALEHMTEGSAFALSPVQPLQTYLELENQVTMTVTDVTSNSATVTIQNNSDLPLFTAWDYALEAYEDGQWLRVPVIELEIPILIPDVLLVISPNDSISFPKDFSFFLPIGAERYRIRKSVIIDTWQTDELVDDYPLRSPINTLHEIVAEFIWN